MPGTTEQKYRWEKDSAQYLEIYIAAQNGEWDTIRKSLKDNVITLETWLNRYCENLIHVIVCFDHGTAFLQELVNDAAFNESVLLERDYDDNTALFLAAMAGNTKAAKIMVEKLPEILTIPDSDGECPVFVAARLGHKETVTYLIAETIKRPDHELDGDMGVLLLNLLITAAFYDLALDLLKEFPALAYGRYNGAGPMKILAKRPLLIMCTSDQQRHQHRAEGIKLIAAICKEIREYTKKGDADQTATYYVRKHFLKAARRGIYEVVAEIIKAWPYMVFAMDGDNQSIYHFAVKHRHEDIFNLIWDLGSNRHRILTLRNDTTGTNILHLAAELGVKTTTLVSGAALQMQREWQWFKNVEEITELSMREEKNTDGKTPRMVFTDEHKGLLKAGEAWMKTTASSSTVVAALIVTVVFAAAFTVPGGNDSKGIPLFLHEPAFIVFAISNAIALFSSSTSLIMFLSILTTRYSEIDFILSLPRKLIIGLSTLFLSILCMLIAFGGALELYLRKLSKYAVIPVVLLICIPALVFMLLESPLLYEIAYSTYGPSIFRQERKPLSHPVNVATPPPVLASASTSVSATTSATPHGPSNV